MGSYYNGTSGCKPAAIASGAEFTCTSIDFTSTGLKNVITSTNTVNSILVDTATPGNNVPSSLGTIAGEALTIGNATTGISLQNAYGNVGGGADPITNLQPYITCYMWKRTN